MRRSLPIAHLIPVLGLSAGLALAAAGAAPPQAWAHAAAKVPRAAARAQPLRPAGHAMTPAGRAMLAWVSLSADNAGQPFAILDKREARIWLFDGDGRRAGDSPVLLGLAPGDLSVPGIGERPMAQIRPEERTTPAGRFIAEPGRNASGEDIFWIDYDAAISMHRVRATNPVERRLQRLATPTVKDNRISYGCINVPVSFYERFIQPRFSGGRGVVYVLPDTLSMEQVFGGYAALVAAAPAAPAAAHALPAASTRSAPAPALKTVAISGALKTAAVARR